MVGVRNETTIAFAVAFPLAILFSGPCAGEKSTSDLLLVANDAGNQEPGRISVTRKEAERALDRSLVQVGAILLDPGRFEVVPSLRYGRREEQTLSFIERNGASVPVALRRSTDEFTAAVAVRLGLPWDSQLEFDLPYHWKRKESVRAVDFSTVESTSSSGMGVGNFRLGIAKTLMREEGWRPDFIGRVTWDTRTGKTDADDVDIAEDFDQVQGSFSAIKRQDPLVFTAGVTYEYVFERHGIQPGTAVAPTFGVLVGLSPETSMRFALSQTFRRETEVEGKPIQGSDRHAATLLVGTSSLLGDGILLNVEGGFGLTEDANEYSLRVSLPVRFEQLMF